MNKHINTVRPPWHSHTEWVLRQPDDKLLVIWRGQVLTLIVTVNLLELRIPQQGFLLVIYRVAQKS